MKSVLLTGFEPFGGDAVNSSWEAVRPMGGEEINGHRIVSRLLPCVFGEALESLDAHIADVRPALVISVGQASRRDKICPERFAFNCDSARIPDNRGNQPKNAPIVPNGPSRYEARLPVANIARALRAAGVPAKVSLSAGRFVCNHVFYGLLHRMETATPDLRGGFIHVPSQMDVATIVEGLRVAIAAAIEL